jgi:hypothetical protein
MGSRGIWSLGRSLLLLEEIEGGALLLLAEAGMARTGGGEDEGEDWGSHFDFDGSQLWKGDF